MKTLASLLLFLTLAAPTAQAAVTLSTDASSFSGTVLDLTGYTGDFTFLSLPITLADGTQVTPVGTAGQGGSVIGSGFYGFANNGYAQATPLVGTNWFDGYIELQFSSLISSFGGFWNYATPVEGPTPFIAAFDSAGTELGSFDLEAVAPISTPGAVDAFAFRSIFSDLPEIASVRFGGSFLAYAPSIAAVPVPAALPLMMASLGLLGFVARRRRT